jgi:hypothetical protein
VPESLFVLLRWQLGLLNQPANIIGGLWTKRSAWNSFVEIPFPSFVMYHGHTSIYLLFNSNQPSTFVLTYVGTPNSIHEIEIKPRSLRKS